MLRFVVRRLLLLVPILLGLSILVFGWIHALPGSPAEALLGEHSTPEQVARVAREFELRMEDGTYPVGPGSVFVLPTPLRHDLANSGTETLKAVAFFAAAMFTQTFDNVMLPPKSHVLGTPNRNG